MKRFPNKLTARLTEQERKRLKICRQTVIDGAQTVWDTAMALHEIHSHKLYREETSTFEEYCRTNFDFGQRRARQLIDALEIRENIGTSIKSGTAVPLLDNEKQARALKSVPPEQRAEVFSKASENGVATEETIKLAAAKTLTEQSKSKPKTATEEPVLDKTGYPVPDRALALWNRSKEVMAELQKLSSIKSVLKTVQEGNDLLWSTVNFSAALADLENAWSRIKEALPYAVCTSCQGQLAKSCLLCKGRGVISRFKWEHVLPEIKAMRAKGAKA